MTKKRNNTRLANFILGGIALGFLLSYPFQTSFVGGLVASGCLAGTIGGLADWFAVTALFRRPLGIRPGKIIRTEIIPQNRERIFRALADMVQNELLSQDVLRGKLADLDFPGLLARFLRAPGIKASFADFLTDLAVAMDETLAKRGLEETLSILLQDEQLKPLLAQIMAEVAELSLKRGHADPFLQAICDAAKEYVEQPGVKVALMKTIEAALARYCENNFARKVVVKSLPEPAVLARNMQAKIKTAFEDGTVRQLSIEYLSSFVTVLKTDSSLQERSNALLLNFIRRSLNGVEQQREKPAVSGMEEEKTLAWFEQLARKGMLKWDEYLDRFEGDIPLQHKAAEKIRGFLEDQITSRHAAIGRMVLEGLAPLTDDKLVELLKDKAGNDLQMIRINGSLVGGLVGMFIYLAGMVFR